MNILRCKIYHLQLVLTNSVDSKFCPQSTCWDFYQQDAENWVVEAFFTLFTIPASKLRTQVSRTALKGTKKTSLTVFFKGGRYLGRLVFFDFLLLITQLNSFDLWILIRQHTNIHSKVKRSADSSFLPQKKCENLDSIILPQFCVNLMPRGRL